MGEVEFPSGAKVAFADADANLCIMCHQGRESTVSVNAAIQRANVGDDTVSPALNFRNPHYFAAGATKFGSEVHGAYEYTGKSYMGYFQHVSGFESCVQCHDSHALTVKVDQCATCHPAVNETGGVRNIRLGSPADYDGDGDTTEGIAKEIETEQEKLLASIQTYAANVIGTPIVYNPQAYPYWYVDDNGDGIWGETETTRYAQWTPTLLRAAYNYQWVVKDPGAFAHNNEYILQILFDSIQAIGGKGATAGMVRP